MIKEGSEKEKSLKEGNKAHWHVCGRACMHACVGVCAHMHMHIAYMYVPVRLHKRRACLAACMHVCACAYVHVCQCMRNCALLWVCACAPVHVRWLHVHACTYVSVCGNGYVCARLRVSAYCLLLRAACVCVRAHASACAPTQACMQVCASA